MTENDDEILMERGRVVCASGAALAAGSLIGMFAWSVYGPQAWQDVVAFPLVLLCALGVVLFGHGLKTALLGPHADLLPM